MRIILANKFNFIKGGADKYFLDLAELLESHGHQVAKFCMAHPENLPDKNERYFAEFVNYDTPGIINKLKAAQKIIWNFEAARKFDALIKDFDPDIIHFGNIYHQLSPSLLSVAAKRGIPAVMHLNDYKLICPNYKLFMKGKNCSLCIGGRYYQCAKNRCMKDSFFKSALASLEMYIHHWILDIYKKKIAVFLAPSQFMAQTVNSWRPDIEKLEVIPYFIKPADFMPDFHPGGYFAYVGRLARGKGIETLIKAWAIAFDEEPAIMKNFKLLIIGSGDLENDLKKISTDSASIEFVGARWGEELLGLIRSSRALIVPSEWQEVSGIVNLEAGALGKPVIASRIAGIKEIIREKESGFLFSPRNIVELAEKILQLAEDPELAASMGKIGSEVVSQDFNDEKHYSKIVKIYNKYANIK
jgi:glycosyltransferase involved in cell wall biosynthesis